MSAVRIQRQTIPFFRSVVAFRAVGLIVALIALHLVMPLGTPILFTAAAGAAGVVGGSLLATSTLNGKGFIALLALLWAGCSALLWGANSFFSGGAGHLLLGDLVVLHANTCFLVASGAALSSWLFWRVRMAVTLETATLVGIAITLFAAHRNFHLDRPKPLTTLAWRLGVDPIILLLAIGCSVLVAATCYLFLAAYATRPQVDRTTVQRAHTEPQLVPSTLMVVLLIGSVWAIQRFVYRYFHEQMVTQVSNGVGMENREGVSPLSFQSALGTSSQPAALVRLEGDYTLNPFSPLLFLRESALSTLSGNELVVAGRGFDSDVPSTRPDESFTAKEDPELAPRTPVVHSVYLIADHKTAFTVDYPVSIVQLKNPRPGRFRATYRVYSIAPSFPPSELAQRDVGDPRWSPEVRTHYLTPHPDARYKELALKITKDATTPIEKAQAITDYLIENAIYTLTPNHDVPPQGDHTATFLFGDNRGYCVHFAHAATYMLRALGIPARIGTGYLTDLSQAKDGHVLLRMSDRHAWAEVYVTDLGWIPFDVQPQQVENHADTQVDAKLLEELMGILEPGEELLPSDPIKDEPGMRDPDEFELPDPRLALQGLGVLAALLVGVKVFLLFGWRLAPTTPLRLRLAYLAALARLYDLGFTRARGETRLQFARRTPHQGLKELTEIVLTQRYAPAKRYRPSPAAVRSAMHTALRACTELPRWRRLLGTLNPASVIKFLGGRLW
jgi:hypothetical protein